MNIYLINTLTKEFPIYEGDFRLRNPNVSFPSPLITPPEPYKWVVSSEQPKYDVITQNVTEGEPSLKDGVWTQTWIISDASVEEIAQRQEMNKTNNKETAIRLLKQTDWVEVPSVSDTTQIPYLTNFEEFMLYRRALRTIAVTPPVVVIEWPVLPKENWTIV